MSLKRGPLFNYTLMGHRYPEVQAQWERTLESWPLMFPDGVTVEKIHELRPASLNMDSTPEEWAAKCDTREVRFDGTPFGSENRNIRMYVHTPIADRTQGRAQIWFHGGGFVFGSAEVFKKSCCRRAACNDVTVFNVDVGTAPETKAPHWFRNGYAALRYVLQEADRLNLDPSRVALTGESSGGYTALGVAMELAKRDEGGLIKLAVPHIGAFNNDFLTEPDAETDSDDLAELYSAVKDLHMQTMAYLCTDPEAQFKAADPDIFPAQMSDRLIPKLPDILLMTAEFDQFRRGNEIFAERLRKHGKLLELYIQPGTGHALFTDASREQFWKDEAKVLAAYL